jgi:long-chain acyl-CoA synthetase
MNGEMELLGNVFGRSVQNFPDKLALKKGDTTYTYRQLKEAVVKLKNYLLELGLQKNDKFAVMGENSPEWAISYLAIVRSGMVCVPVDRMSQDAEIIHILTRSESKGIIVSETYLENINEIKADIKNVKHIIPMSKIKQVAPKKDYPVEGIDPKGLAVLIFTSGTTGTSKAVMLSHYNIMCNMKSVERFIEINETDSLCSIIPMHHTFEGTAGFLFPLFRGATIYYPPSLKPTDILATMKEAKVTCLIAVPLLFEKFVGAVYRKVGSAPVPTKVMFKAISGIGTAIPFLRKTLFKRVRKEMGLGHIKIAAAGGAALTEKVAKALELLAIPIVQGYGLTETSPVISVSPLAKPKVKSVGLPIPDVEVKIVDKDENGIGEIITRGPNVMLGYYKNEEATKEVLKDGWLYTGDLGYLDDEGYVYITGRKKSLIVTQTGKNIQPEEIEAKLIKSEWIKEVLVIPRIDQKTKKEQIAALIFPDYERLEQHGQEKGIEMSELDVENIFKEIVREVNEHLPIYKKVTAFEIRDEEFPKTSTQKIKRHLFVDRGVRV